MWLTEDGPRSSGPEGLATRDIPLTFSFSPFAASLLILLSQLKYVDTGFSNPPLFMIWGLPV